MGNSYKTSESIAGMKRKWSNDSIREIYVRVS